MNAAAYYVLAQNNRADILWGDGDDVAERPLTEAYRLLKNGALKAEEMRDAGNYFISAYKQGQISFEEAAEWQNQLINTSGGFDEIFADAAERIFGADDEENSGDFAEKKAKKVLEFFEAYNAEKSAHVAEFVDNGGVLTPAMAKKFSREAVKIASEDYGFAEDEEKWRKDWMTKSESYFDDENAKKYAENEYAGTLSDAEVEADKSSFDKDKFVNETMRPMIQKHEKITNYPYLDSANNKTIGVGSNIQSNPWVVQWYLKDAKNGQMTKLDNENPQHRRIVEKELAKLDKYKGQNMRAEAFEPITNLRMANEDIDKEYQRRMDIAIEDVKWIINDYNKSPQNSEKIDDFEDMPEPLQKVLVDMSFNLGRVRFNWKLSDKKVIVNGKSVIKKNGYPNFWKALAKHDIDNMLEHCIRNKDDESFADRNQEIQNLLRKLLI